MHLDTQVVSYAWKEKWDQPITGSEISSIVANEFLLAQHENRIHANYYVPIVSIRHLMASRENRNRDHPFNRVHSDSVVMDFGNEFPSIVEYNNLSIATVINNQSFDLFASAINHLEKPQKKTLLKRMRFLLDNGLTCVPINDASVDLAFQLLQKFREHHNPKENFRNTWNDMLILSCAQDKNSKLVTEDSLLARFAAETAQIDPIETPPFLELPYRKEGHEIRKRSKESKGYINNGWRAKFSTGKSPNPKNAR